MRRFVLIFLVFVSACNSPSKKNLTKQPTDPRIFRAGGVILRMSGVFVESGILDVEELWGKSGLPQELIYKKISELQAWQAFEGPSFIFRDTTNIRNTFFFTEASYLDVEEGNEEKLFTEFESVMTENSKKIGATCKLVENDFFSLSNGDKVYKMLYEVNYTNEKEYSTTYYITSKMRVVMVIVNNTSDDGEAIVRSMNVDPYFYEDLIEN
ncbi:MAG: hypothetical protein WDO14_21080 [Bacteroidota bacterium]